LQVALQLFLGVAVTQEISAQPHARDRSLKAARDSRQNLDPFRSLLGNASLHGVECGSSPRHFLRTILRERLTAQIRTQAVGGASISPPSPRTYRYVGRARRSSQAGRSSGLTRSRIATAVAMYLMK